MELHVCYFGNNGYPYNIRKMVCLTCVEVIFHVLPYFVVWVVNAVHFLVIQFKVICCYCKSWLNSFSFPTPSHSAILIFMDFITEYLAELFFVSVVFQLILLDITSRASLHSKLVMIVLSPFNNYTSFSIIYLTACVQEFRCPWAWAIT